MCTRTTLSCPSNVSAGWRVRGRDGAGGMCLDENILRLRCQPQQPQQQSVHMQNCAENRNVSRSIQSQAASQLVNCEVQHSAASSRQLVHCSDYSCMSRRLTSAHVQNFDPTSTAISPTNPQLHHFACQERRDCR